MNEVRHLRALQAFDAAATHSSLSKAAHVLGVTHGAVSRQVKQLEQYLGVTLLNRLPQGVEKTAAGQQLHGATRQAFSALQIGVRGVKRNDKGRSVTISLSSSLAIKWLVPNLPSFRSKHPELNVLLDTNDEVINFADSDVDVALRFGVPDWEELHYERLSDEKLVVVAAPGLVAHKVLPLTPAEIVRLPMLRDQFYPAWGDWADAVGLDRTDIDRTMVTLGDLALLIAAAIDGQGIALARHILVEKDLAAGRLIRLHDSTFSLDRALYFVCRKGDQDRSEFRLLRRWLHSLFGPESRNAN